MVISVRLSFHLYAIQFNDIVGIYYGDYGLLHLAYLNGIVGTFWIFLLVKAPLIYRAVSWVGRNTLLFLAFHSSAMTVIKAIILFGFAIGVTITLRNSFLYSALQILL